jgi:hypothetical protein
MGHLKDLNRHGRPQSLELDTHHLKKGEQVGPEGDPYRMPSAVNNNGQGDPPRALRPLGMAPPRLGTQVFLFRFDDLSSFREVVLVDPTKFLADGSE